MEDKMKLVYEEAIKFLYKIRPEEITDAKLENYFNLKKTFHSKQEINDHLFASLQNYQRMSNAIGYFDENRKKEFKKIFYNFDEKKILKNYKNWEDLFNVFSEKFGIPKNSKKKKNNFWVRYSRAIYSACIFMNQFEDEKDFDCFIKKFTYNESTRAALPMLLAREIHGMGFALACDFIKELGYTDYPKPDIHLIDVFSKLNLSDRDEYSCYKAIIRMANIVGETPYKVDKVFWLICSGNYYNEKISIRRNKEKFIKLAKSHLKKD